MNINYFKIPLFVTCLILLFLSSCKNKNKQDYSISAGKKLSQGKAIVMQNCMTCHASDIAEQNRIAPTLIDIKANYLKHFKTEDYFVSGMTTFLLDPNPLKSKMPDMIEKYNIMPNLGLSKEDYVAAAYYIFNTNIDKPISNKDQSSTENYGDDYLKKGQSLALSTKAVLGKNLLTAIKTKGTEHALEFCNERAIVLTDSMANHLNAKIKRVSDKNRNPDNKANALELDYINSAKKELAEHGKITPLINELDDKVVGYYPIITNNMCLQCHGKPQGDISQATLSKIERLYPNDKAIEYSAKELRGIWVVEMEK